jgi:hypothetical protein
MLRTFLTLAVLVAIQMAVSGCIVVDRDHWHHDHGSLPQHLDRG